MEENESVWYGQDPGITTEQWMKLLHDSSLVTDNNLITLRSLFEHPDGLSCAQLADEYGRDWHFYLSNVSTLGEKVAKNIGLVEPNRAKGTFEYWTVLCLTKPTDEGQHGYYIYKLRPELRAALEKMDLSMYPLRASEDDASSSVPTTSGSYSDKDFLREVFLSGDALKELKGLLLRKRNLILQGAPGTGKTFAAKRLAYTIMGQKDDMRIQSVQFHQSTSYDEFVYGYRPNDDGVGFRAVPGIFTQFVQKAKVDQDRPYFFIIDEINRANISKVFGELLSTIEFDHRNSDDAVVLPITGQPFYVPKNLYIIGMMNTADRGLALIDYALRRRFAFFTMKPQLDNPNFKKQVGKLGDARLLNLIEAVSALNKVIAEDDALGDGFCIGHSYFCDNETEDDEDLAASIVKFELVPMIEEYWFDNKKQIKQQSDLLWKAVQ